MKLRVSPGFDPLKAKVGPEEYFVLSRIDGVLTLREVLLQTGLPVERGIAIITKLRSIGALLLPGETRRASAGCRACRAVHALDPSNARPARSPLLTASRRWGARRDRRPGHRRSRSRRPRRALGPHHRRPPRRSLLVLPNPTTPSGRRSPSPASSTPDVRIRILAMARLVAERDPWALLGVPQRRRRQGAQARVLQAVQGDPSRPLLRQAARHVSTTGSRWSSRR